MPMTIIEKIQARWCRGSRKALQAYYKFDKWHVSPFSSRNYARAIVDYLKNCDRKGSIAEIGCGLADILRNVNFRNRFGYDSDIRVLKAAKLLACFDLSKGKYQFAEFVFPSALEGKYDVILLVNWIHHIEPSTLKAYIAMYFEVNLPVAGTIILDTVANPAYKHNHDIDYLTGGLDCSLRCIGTFENDRKVWAIKKSSDVRIWRNN